NTHRVTRTSRQRCIRSLSLIFTSAVLLLGQGEEAQVRAVVQKYVDARDHMDAKAIEAVFTADADQLVSTGEWRKGRDEVVKGTMASSQSSSGKRTITVVSVRFPARGVAIADGRYEIAASTGSAARSMWTSLILTRGSDGWRIAAIRNMLPAPAK
ncbi:MAG TPA: SgcJ/EcaC family oxidoreductase, partial [Bryobacteraceae bacterium]|nr:SgcJ/EcaC family oxidoreductase [Bryobacteraceae bacterium]